jgi:hypothetical protein
MEFAATAAAEEELSHGQSKPPEEESLEEEPSLGVQILKPDKKMGLLRKKLWEKMQRRMHKEGRKEGERKNRSRRWKVETYLGPMKESLHPRTSL